jgi:acyl CoA:acetate/3-ketoacid CoA transferase beta subunit
MKTTTNTLFAAFTVFLITLTAMQASAAHNFKTFDTPIIGINKIWVSGNVKVILTQSEVESVSVDETYNANNTSIQTKGQTIYINSAEQHQVTIRVSIKDLQRIEAAGGSSVVSSGNLSVKYLQVFLNQCATAKIKTTAGSVYTVITDQAVLKMSGTADEHILVAKNMRNARIRNFLTQKTESKLLDAIAMRTDSLTAELVK